MKTFAPGCWTLAVVLSVASSYSSADETLSLEKIGEMGEAGTALVEIKDRLGRGFGSAFCIHSSGLFLTNNHVAQGDITIILNAGLKTEKSYKAKVVRSDKEMDLALLRIEGVKDLPTLSLGSDEKLKRLMQVVAVGFPYGDALAQKGNRYPEVSTNVGSITSLRHNKDNDALLDRIQLDAVLNPGNSGGPILDKNGKVVGVVQGGIRGAGVNFAIPVNVVTRFVARPDIHFEPPQLGAVNIHKSVLFEAQVLQVIETTNPITVELVLKAGKGKERRYRMEAAADGKYQATVVPLPPPQGGETVRVLAEFGNSLVNATTADRTFKVGVREVKLSEVDTIQFQPAGRVVLQDGKVVEGVVSGLEAVPVRLGEQSVPVDLGKAAEVRFGTASETDEVSYTLVVRQGDKDILRQTETLVVEGLLPSPAAMLERPLEMVGEIRSFLGHRGAVGSVAFSRDGKLAASGGGGQYLAAGRGWLQIDDYVVRLWDVKTGKELRQFVGHKNHVTGLAFSPNGRLLASAGTLDESVRIWEVATGKELLCTEGHNGRVSQVAFLPDGQHVLAASYDGLLRLWDVKSGKEVRKFEGHQGPIDAVAVSSDGCRALSGGYDRTVRLWEVESGKELVRFSGHTDTVQHVAFSQDGCRALSCSIDKSIRLWDIETGKELRRFDGHTDIVQRVAFLPNGRYALSCSFDGTVRLWEVETGKEVHRLTGPTSAVFSIAISADGHYALSGSNDKTVRLWRLPAFSPRKDKP